MSARAAVLAVLAVAGADSASAAPVSWNTATASWYGLYGSQTACGGARYQGQNGVAHKTLPCGTKVRLLNPRTHKRITVRVIDRGPYVAGREFDLTEETKNRLACGDLCTVKWRIPAPRRKHKAKRSWREPKLERAKLRLALPIAKAAFPSECGDKATVVLRADKRMDPNWQGVSFPAECKVLMRAGLRVDDFCYVLVHEFGHLAGYAHTGEEGLHPQDEARQVVMAGNVYWQPCDRLVPVAYR